MTNHTWASISMDMLTDLPLIHSSNSVVVVVDRFTKMAHFTPCSKTISGKGMTHLLLNNVVHLHELPDDVISDRRPPFVFHFWQHLLQTLGISVKLSSTYHPQTDGQTERVNQILEQLVFSARFITNMMIGSTYFHKQNLPTIILSMHRPTSLHSLQTMLYILGSTFSSLPLS